MLTPTMALHWARKMTRNKLSRWIFFFIMRRNYKHTRGHKRNVYKYPLHVNNREIHQENQNRPCVTTPEFPEAPKTTQVKPRVWKSLYPPLLKDFGSPVVLLLKWTNKPIRICLLHIFLELFRGTRKTFFRPSICNEEIRRSMLFTRGEVVQFTVLFRSLRKKNLSESQNER